MKKRALIYGFIVVAACLIWLWPITLHLSAVPFWPESAYSDLLVSHLPNAITVNSSLVEYKQIPLWNPTILGGTPANADPLVGLWYPPRWLTFLFPTSAVFNLLIVVHLIWAALGVYRLARLEGASDTSALIAGILFAGTPKLMAHLALGHIDLIFALSWTPWVILTLGSLMLRIATIRPVHWLAVQFGLIVGIQFLADPRWLIPVVLLGLLYVGLIFTPLKLEHGFTGRQANQAARSLALGAVVAAATAAPLALPLIQYSSLSTRRLMTLADQSLFSFPPLRVVSLVLPFNDVPEWVAYLGAALWLLWMAGIILRSRPARYWGLVAAFFLLLALGPATPLFSVIGGIPGFQLLRVPARFLVFISLAASMGAAHGIDRLMGQTQESSLQRKLNLASAAVGGVVFSGLAVVIFVGQPDRFVRILQVVISVAGALILILARRRLQNFRRFYPALWLALIGLDFLWMNASILEARQVDMAAEPPWLEQIEVGEWGELRLFSTSYSLGQEQAARNHIEMVDGVHPLQISAYFDFLAQATGFDSTQYSVTLPPFPEGDPQRVWDARIAADQLALLNTRYIVSDFPLDEQSLELIDDQSSFVYENSLYRPRAWLEPANDIRPWAAVENVEWSPNRIVVQVTGPGLLVLSEVDYPGWEAALDGESLEISTYEGLLRSVDLPSGEHRVEWFYRPILTWIGMGAWGVLILALVIVRLQRWK